jgi:hypothetical protein
MFKLHARFLKTDFIKAQSDFGDKLRGWRRILKNLNNFPFPCKIGLISQFHAHRQEKNMRFLIPVLAAILLVSFLNAPEARAAQCRDIYFNKDARSFFPQYQFGSASSLGITAYTYADINNDGNLDIVAGIRTDVTRLIVFNGDGRGKFQPGAVTPISSSQSLGFGSNGLQFVHLNNDSTLDLMAFGGATASVYFGNNDGTFAHQNSSQLFSLFPFCCPKLLDTFDINGDGRKDILVTEIGPESGNTFVRVHLADANYAFPSEGTWIINGAASVLVEDFNNDGRKDIAANFRDSTSNFMRFYYNRGDGAFSPSQTINLGDIEKLRLAHDFDGDGWKDFVATALNAGIRSVSVLYNNADQGFSVANYPITTNFAAPFFDLNDYDGDGVKDFAAFNEHGYNIYFRKRVGGFQRSYQNIQTTPSGQSTPNLFADFNNDKKADILRIGTNFTFQTHTFLLFEAECFRRGRADTIDYIGNGKQNFATWQPETGRWTYTDAGFAPQYYTVFWGSGALGDVPVPGDYDGDGVTDTAVFRQPTGTWHVNTKKLGTISFEFGASGDKPVPADYDGDFKTDLAVFRPASGDWMIRLSATGTSLLIHFGLSEDKPVPADYDGDGKADVAIFRPSEGAWYYLRSSDNAKVAAQFGQAGDIPQPTDVDGDGRADFNVFRPSAAVFYFASSFDGRSAFVSRGQGGIPQPASGYFLNNFYTYRPSDGNWFGDSMIAVTQTPPNEIPVSYVLPAGN